ncbi:hypothetical protein G419_16915 [Rhodococcus triatomae BKS 15-14]|nr:hypothetical protein G419_16915 [Rhodococcus triatomae BKS 15-14]
MRRRNRLPVEYGPSFSLPAEVEAIVQPLAERVAAMRGRHMVAPEVDALVTATHKAVVDLTRQVAIGEAAGRTRHLTGTDQIAARAALVDAVELPERPATVGAALASVAWGWELVSAAERVSAVLSTRLGGPQVVRGMQWSERVLVALRPVDAAAVALEQRLDRLERATADRARQQAVSPREKALALLASMDLQPLDVLGGGER